MSKKPQSEPAVSNEGHEFVLLIKLDASAIPSWLPPTRIWVGYERYGLNGLASVIEARVQALGGTVRSETPVDRAARIGRQLNFETERNAWRGSEQAVQSAREEAESLVGEFEQCAADVTLNVGQVQIQFTHYEAGHCALASSGVTLCVEWHNTFANVLDRSGLNVWIHRGGIVRSGVVFEEPETVDETRYDIDLDTTGAIGWRESDGERRFFTSPMLMDHWMKRFLDQISVSNESDDTAW